MADYTLSKKFWRNNQLPKSVLVWEKKLVASKVSISLGKKLVAEILGSITVSDPYLQYFQRYEFFFSSHIIYHIH